VSNSNFHVHSRCCSSPCALSLLTPPRFVFFLADEPRLCRAASALLLAALELDPAGAADSLAAPPAVLALASLVAAPGREARLQVGAARALALVAALPARREGATRALLDSALPRACEVLRQGQGRDGDTGAGVDAHEEGGGGGGGGGEAQLQLQAACAALVARLATCSRLACHVILFHTELLHPLVAVLVGSRQCALAQALLAAAADYADAPSPELLG
jgi:hypothetical protein